MSNRDVTVPAGNILIVDDTPANLRLLSKMLGRHGYEVRPIPNGKLAIAATQAALPDLILLDINMPDMNGYEVCRQLKADEKTRNIPIIFISALNEVTDKVEAFKVGGVDYVTKPFQVEEVLARINTHLTIRNLQENLETKNAQLQDALNNIKTLKGMVPICANCKNIRDDEGFWQKVEAYIETRSDVEFTHGICPDCREKLYPEYYGE